MDAPMRKLRISIKTLAIIEIVAIAIFMILLFVGMRQNIQNPNMMAFASFLSLMFLMQLLNGVWLVSFDKDYPWIYRVWVFKQAILLYILGTIAFYYTAYNWNVATFLPVALIISEFVLVRMYREKQQEASAYQRMQEPARQV